MKKLCRLCTTISIKHWELLKKHKEKYGTQQKVIELALENLEKNEIQSPMLSLEDQLRIRMCKELKMICHLHKDLFFELLKTADFERIAETMIKLKLSEYQVVWYYQKPLKECSLKEVIDGIVITTKMGNWLDTINYTDDDHYYSLKVTHSGGSMNYSKGFKIFFESLFRAYGVKTQSEISENSLFMKVFKP